MGSMFDSVSIDIKKILKIWEEEIISILFIRINQICGCHIPEDFIRLFY